MKKLAFALLFAAIPGALLAQEKETPKKHGKDKEVAAKKVDFATQVFPIFEKRCIECHAAAQTVNGKTKKPKGGVVLDGKDGILASKRGKLVVAGKSADSLLVESICLPADNEDRMPPPKKGDPLSKEQIDLIKSWIDDGADFGKWTGKAKDGEQGKGSDNPKDGDKPKGEVKSEKHEKGETSERSESAEHKKSGH